MEMHILLGDNISLGFPMVAVAHASRWILRFKDKPEVTEWFKGF
jgi:hypothetical protein